MWQAVGDLEPKMNCLCFFTSTKAVKTGNRAWDTADDHILERKDNDGYAIGNTVISVFIRKFILDVMFE